MLLDALGTLVELEPPAPRLRAGLFDRFGVSLTPAESERAVAAEIAFYRAHLDEGRDAATVDSLRRRCAAALREALPAEARAAAADIDAVTSTLLSSLRFRLFADVPPALTGLRARGLRLVVVSNWDVSLHGVLDRLGVGPLLDGVLTSAEAGARKPAPQIFERALALAGASADEAIHVGDSVEEDLAGARAAGIESVLLTRGSVPGDLPSDARTIASLVELVPPATSH